MKPVVSVILPAYNAEKYIASAIESILNQTFTNFEFIIIDDCSQDKTPLIIKEYEKKDSRIRFIQNKKNMKLSHTLNIGIKHAKGKYIARMDADDWSYPDRLEKQVAFLDKHPKVGIVGGFMKIMNEKGRIYSERKYSLNDADIRKNIYLYSPFSHPTIMMRKSILDKVGLYNHLFNPAEDYELYFRIGNQSLFANLSTYLIKYRIVGGGMTTGSMRRMEEKTIEVRFSNFANPVYKPRLYDLLYTWIEKISLYIIPDRLKLWLFNFLRDKKVP